MELAAFATTAVSGALLGLTSLPHCAAMCGPLSAAVCARSGGGSAALRYQVGRVLGYSVAGVVAGRFSLAVSDTVPAPLRPFVFPLLTGLSALFVALQLWPRRARTKVASREVVDLRPSATGPVARRVLAVLPREATYVGFATAVLPCGALAAALLFAAGRGDGLSGAVFMASFGLVSGLATLTAASLAGVLRSMPQSGLVHVRRAAALAILGFAVLSLTTPLRAHFAAAEPGPATTTAVPHCH